MDEFGHNESGTLHKDDFFSPTFSFVYFWLLWVFVAAHGAFSSGNEQGCSSWRHAASSLWWLLSWSSGCRLLASVAAARA